MLDHLNLSGLEIATDVVERMVRRDVDPVARVLSVTRRSGIGVNTVFEATLSNGRSVILKIRSPAGLDSFEREAYQLGYLADRAHMPVPRVLAHRKDGQAGPFTYMILSEIPGLPWSHLASLQVDASLPQRQVGDLLGRMHAEVTAVEYREVLPVPGAGLESWTSLFASLWDERLRATVESGRLDTPTLDAVDWIHKHLVSLLDVKDVPRLIHGNLRADNIIVRSMDQAWVLGGFLDPDLCYGHHEVDLAALELYCRVGTPFFEAYSQHLPVAEAYSVRKHLYTLYMLLDEVRMYGSTHHILGVMDVSRRVLQGCT